MLSIQPMARVFVAIQLADTRGSFDSLAGAVRRLGLDPFVTHSEAEMTSGGRVTLVSRPASKLHWSKFDEGVHR
jgi:hypothetical protein